MTIYDALYPGNIERTSFPKKEYLPIYLGAEYHGLRDRYGNVFDGTV